MVFSHHWIDILCEIHYGWVGGEVGLVGVVACRIIVSVPFLWTLDFGLGFWTWILNLDLGLDLESIGSSLRIEN